MATLHTRISPLTSLTRQQNHRLPSSVLPVALATRRSVSSAALLPDEPRRSNHDGSSKSSNQTSKKSSRNPVSSHVSSTRKGLGAGKGSLSLVSGAKGFRAVVSFAIRKLRGGGGVWEGQHEVCEAEERDGYYAVEMGEAAKGAVENDAVRSNPAGVGENGSRVQSNCRPGAWDTPGGSGVSRGQGQGQRTLHREEKASSERHEITERAEMKGDSKRGMDDPGGWEGLASDIPPVPAYNAYVSTGVTNGAVRAVREDNGSSRGASEGTGSSRGAEAEGMSEEALDRQHEFRQERLSQVLGAVTAVEDQEATDEREGMGEKPGNCDLVKGTVQVTASSSPATPTGDGGIGAPLQSPADTDSSHLFSEPVLTTAAAGDMAFSLSTSDVGMEEETQGIGGDERGEEEEEGEDGGEEEEGEEEEEEEEGLLLEAEEGGQERKSVLRRGLAVSSRTLSWISDVVVSPALSFTGPPVARAFNSLPRIRMGVLLDVARSVRASAGGMGAWSMRDLTHGLYLLSLQHAEERAVDTVASTPVTDEQTVQDLIYHCEFAKAAIATSHRAIAQACMVRPNRIVKIVPKARYGRPAYFIALDDKRRLVVVSFRGTRSAHDMLTNLAAHSVHVSTVQRAAERGREDGSETDGEERSGEREGDYFIESDGMEGEREGDGVAAWSKRKDETREEQRRARETTGERGSVSENKRRSEAKRQPANEFNEQSQAKPKQSAKQNATQNSKQGSKQAPREETMEDVVGEEERRDMDEVIAFGHYGMVQAAETFVHEESPLLRHLLAHHPGYDLRLIGHSLGAAVAALVTILLRPQAQGLLGITSERVRCVGFATPPCVSRHLALSCRPFITTVVLQDDIVPRLSLHALESLRNEVVACAAAQPSKEKRARPASSDNSNSDGSSSKNNGTSSSDNGSSISSSSCSSSSSSRSNNGSSISISSASSPSHSTPNSLISNSFASVQELDTLSSTPSEAGDSNGAAYREGELTNATILRDSTATDSSFHSLPLSTSHPPPLSPHSPPNPSMYLQSPSDSSAPSPSSASPSSQPYPTTTNRAPPEELDVSDSCSSALDALYTFSSSRPRETPVASSRTPRSSSSVHPRSSLRSSPSPPPPPALSSPDSSSLLTKLKSKRWRKKKKERELSRHELLLLQQVQMECYTLDEHYSNAGAANTEANYELLPQHLQHQQQQPEGEENGWEAGSDLLGIEETAGNTQGMDDKDKIEMRYAPGKLYHIVRDKKDGEHVLLEAQGSARFERIVLSSSLLSDHLVNSYMYALRDVLKGM
ncbi:unnamed protein product [Closterium sp. NIES-64]|nr:unnamed protein product [Closterium sp. NIES-64]